MTWENFWPQCKTKNGNPTHAQLRARARVIAARDDLHTYFWEVVLASWH